MQMNEANESIYIDDEEPLEAVLPKSRTKGRNGPNSMLQTISPTGDNEFDDIEESGRDTKLIMPIKHKG